ncbi:hypothetical protein GCM10025863_03780 [Microbacterium suwonense]|uniref:Exoribonuclease phosphorolytic domain-containing protein n=1 Tax=Microbacterium suwonense TaxID=683047 RepID=A0ABM8FQ29_9MICO|nr:hypothetical protein GCM10025863_03780 [Microbacterium suwonense]
MTDIVRADGRSTDQLREITIERGWSANAEGSALISFGGTKVLCTASFTNGVPRWLTGKGKGGSPPSTPCCLVPPTAATTARA